MAIEIERKFLLANDSWRTAVTDASHLIDGIIARDRGNKVRVRLSGRRAWLTVKGPRRGISKLEFEYEIPYSDGLIMLQSLSSGPCIERIRHLVPFGGLIWAVDVHLGVLEGTSFAEVELEHAYDALRVPSWAGREITHEPEMSKDALMARSGSASRRSGPVGYAETSN